MNHFDLVAEKQKRFFEQKLQRFIDEMLKITSDEVPHDQDTTKSERDLIKEAQATLTAFFRHSVGDAGLLVNGAQHLLVSSSAGETPVTLQWEDKGGIMIKHRNPHIPNLPNYQTVEWAKKNLKLSFRGEIKQTLEPHLKVS